MPIHYTINEKLNIAVILCEGSFLAQEYFAVMRTLAKEPNYKEGMLKIVDLYAAREEFDLADMRESLAYNESSVKAGRQLDHTVVLSYSRGVHEFVKTMKLLSGKTPIKFDAFTTLEEAITELGLSEQRQEILDFCQGNKVIKD